MDTLERVGSEYLRRGGDPEGFARSLERAQLGEYHDADYEADYRGRPSFVENDDAIGEAPAARGAAMGAIGPLFGASPNYDNDEFADRFRSDSVTSVDSIGNPRRKLDLLETIQRIEGSEGRFGGVAGHRMPRRIKMPSHVSDMSGTLGLSSGEAPAQRRGFFNGSWNPFTWNWRNLFRRRR